MNAFASWHNALLLKLESLIPADLLALAARLGIAAVFWQSGRTKVDEQFHVTDSAIALFTDEFKLPLLDPAFAAHLAAYAEHLFPLLLALGLFTRLSALALLVMTMTIQIFVFPDAWWTEHSLWAALALVLIVRGGGIVAIDKLLTRRREA